MHTQYAAAVSSVILLSPPKECDYVFTSVCLPVCFSLRQITQKLWTDLMNYYEILWSSGTRPIAIIDLQGGPKNWHNILYALTLPNINRFSKFFHCQNQEKICNNTVTKDPTTPQLCRYTTLCPIKAPRCGVLPSRLSWDLLFKTLYLLVHLM